MASVGVIELSGIGPALAAAFNGLGVFTTGDLLRVERRRIAREVDGASVAQLRRWQAVSELLEVDGVTLAIAEGLVIRGVDSMDEMSGRPLSSLRDVVATMRADGVIDVVPSDDELVGWITEAVRFRHTGTLNGTVTGSGNAPLAGVSIVGAGQTVESDARGRFRLRGLPLGHPVLVYLEAHGYVAKTVEVDAAPPKVVRGEQFRLSLRRATTPAERVLSELNGDELPPLAGAPVRQRAQNTAPPEHDILRVVEVLAGGDARVISRLFDYSEGVFVVRSYRLAPADLPAGIEAGEHLRFSAGAWKVVTLTAKDIGAYRRKLRERRRWPQLPADPTAADIDRAIREWQAAREAAR